MVDVGEGGPEIFHRGNRFVLDRDDIVSVGPISSDTELFDLLDVFPIGSLSITPEMFGLDKVVDMPMSKYSLTRDCLQSRFSTPEEVEDGFYSEMTDPVQKPKPGAKVGLSNDQNSDQAARYHLNQADKWIEENVWKIFHENADAPLLDTIYSDAFQRLRFVDQHGPQSYRKNNPQVDRFEHSVGVMMLLRKFDASRDEQLAALLHDIGHGPFSHWSEYVLENDDFEFHEDEDIIRSRLEADGTAQRLEEQGLDLEHLLDKENFPLLEQPKPDLCADRIDYFLRDLYYIAGQEASLELSGPLEMHPDKEETKLDVEWQEIVNYVDSLEVHEGDEKMFVMNDPEAAVDFAERYMQLDQLIWSNPINNMAQYKGVGDAAIKALDHGEVSEEEFFEMTDLEVLNMLIPRYDDSKEHLRCVEDYFTKENLSVVEDEREADLCLSRHPRWVDPKVKEGKNQSIEDMERASDYDPDLKRRIQEHRDMSEEIYVEVDGLDYKNLEPEG
ncbi:MAG: HD domain-containing protein [Candidatus Nanohalobium sp.]